MNLKNRQTLLAVIAIALVGLFILDQVVLGPLLANWRKRGETIADLRESIRKGQSLIARENITRGVWNDQRKNTLPAGASQAE
jgi:hypothetical protein